MSAGHSQIRFHVGTYAKEEEEGVHHCLLDLVTGRMTRTGGSRAGANPSYIALHPGGRFLFAVNELREGAVSSYAVDAATGGLTALSSQPSHGAHPCHLCTDPAGRVLMVANYSSGTAAAYPVRADGRIGEASWKVQHQGRGKDDRAQSGPRAHAMVVDPTGRFVMCCDLGIDKVLTYRLIPGTDTLELHGSLSTAPGAGPRHLDFHPNGRFAYLINELDCTLTALTYDGPNGILAATGTLPLLLGEGTGKPSGSEVAVHPSGRFVYTSVRGRDAILIHAVDQATGGLALAGHAPSGGKTPRQFAIDPSGSFLLAANQDGDNVVSFAIDQDHGSLTRVGEIAVSKPVCVLFG